MPLLTKPGDSTHILEIDAANSFMPFCYEDSYGHTMNYTLVTSKSIAPTAKDQLVNVPSTSYPITNNNGKLALELAKNIRSLVGSSQYYVLIQSLGNSTTDQSNEKFIISKKLTVNVVENLDACATFNQFNLTIDSKLLS